MRRRGLWRRGLAGGRAQAGRACRPGAVCGAGRWRMMAGNMRKRRALEDAIYALSGTIGG